jgi:aryl-alcohol dehydrogenase-like predicted oxidoreductase
MRYVAAAERQGLPRVVSIQNSYSLLDRQFEIGLAEVAIREKIGLLAYSPLASGTLTGKYGKSAQAIPASRSSESAAFTKRLLTPARIEAIDAYGQIAQDYGIEPAHLALAFAARQPFLSSVLMAASTVEQLQSNLGVLDISLPADIVKVINAVHDRHPNPK